MLIRAVLGFALFETLALVGVLLAFADRVAGARALAAFLTGFAIWVCGNELPNWFGPEVEPWTLALVATAPLTSAFFFHFCVVFCRTVLPRAVPWNAVLGGAYALALAAVLYAELHAPGYLIRHADIGWLGIANEVGMATSTAWVLLGTGGVAVLLYSLLRAQGTARRQIAAVTASCLWGIVCLCGYGFAILDWPVYPWPLLGLPLYPLILVYGILRYGVFVANAWARRALVWALLLALGAAIVALMPLLLPIESRWIAGLAVAASVIALNGPVRRFAERLVYPGGAVTVTELGRWRTQLAAAETPAALAERAAALLGAHLGIAVAVDIASDAPLEADAGRPRLACRSDGAGGWVCAFDGWDAAPPGQRHAAELFGAELAAAAQRVEQAQQIAARERERQLQARLAELGSLAATVAHDIRNPLNIIAMAVAGAPPDTRREVADQVARISHLTRDLLDYAKPWKLALAPLDLSAQVRAAALRLPGVELGAGLDTELVVSADARRVDQALTNLLENARVALTTAADRDGSGSGSARICIDAERTADAVRLHVCDGGPGVPAEIRARMFEPFASRSPGGTGLGLAIVARIMAAHGGSVALTERPPWRTCITLTFPNRS